MKTITLTDEQFMFLMDVLDECQDEGLLGEGWASDKLKELIKSLQLENK